MGQLVQDAVVCLWLFRARVEQASASYMAMNLTSDWAAEAYRLTGAFVEAWLGHTIRLENLVRFLIWQFGEFGKKHQIKS